nr:2-oxoglutarate-dependent dioxygenase dao [Quercus suber]
MQKLEEDDGEQQQQQQLKRLREASEESGCFRIVNHKIPSSLIVIAGSGYMAPTQVNPLYEALGLYDLASSQSLRTFSSQLDLSPHQRETIELYAEAIHELAIDLGRMLAKSMGLASLFKDGLASLELTNTTSHLKL